VPLPRLRSACFFVLLAALGASCLADGPAFRLADGDRVVLLGSTFVERAQSHGYLESALTTRYPGADIKFRNLGWSGDNVFGESRAGFGDVAHGFNELKAHVKAVQPTVILLNYGAAESFAGKAGLDHFLTGLDTLLAALDETGARIVFLAPTPHEKLAPPLPDPAPHNKDLKLYCDAIAKVAAARQAPFVNLHEVLGKLTPAPAQPLTSDGLQFTAYGYWRAAPALEQAIGLDPRAWKIEVDVPRANITARGTSLGGAKFSPEVISFRARDGLLPYASPPEGTSPGPSASPRVVRFFDLPSGTYTLAIDGRQVATADARGWADGVEIASGAEFDQVEKLREAILAKNELYFHRWRPQNVTYLFGFRKHEQGNNAVEIPQFDPLVAAREEQIRQLSVPVEHEYQLKKVQN